MLAINNIRVSPPTAPGGTGSVLFDVIGNTVPTGTIIVYCPIPLGDPIPPGGISLPAHALPAYDVAVTGIGSFAPSSTWLIAVFESQPSDLDTGASFVMPVYTAPPVRGCTDPDATNYNANATEDDGTCSYAPPARHAHFVLSPALGLRFVQPGAADLPEYDNRLLIDERPLNTTNPGYCQPVERGDTLVLQFQSNYNGTPTVQVKPVGGGPAVLTVAPTRVVQGAGQSPNFEGYARPDTLANRTRIYFNSDTLPYPFLPGDRVTLSGAGSLSHTYPLVDVREDPAALVPYLVLPVAYPTGAQRIDLMLSTPYALQVFDTWQVVLPFNAVPEGCHQVHITVTDTEFGTAEAVSEPLDVAGQHRNTVVVLYRNFDNGFNLNYTHGLINRLRVVARFFDRKTAQQKDVLRESTGRLTLMSASAQRKIQLDTYLLPGWMHEKLAVAFCHDFVRVNELEVIAEEAYEYEATPNYTLSKGSVQLEQIDFLGAGNRDDLGDVDSGDVLLLVNNQYLKVNP